MQGILYGIGVGPGDPELLTLKGARLIKEADVIALPQKKEGMDIVALEIVKPVVDVSNKTLLPLNMPMTKDADVLEQAHSEAADKLIALLKDGKKVCFLTLGDPTVYSTYVYVHKKVLQAGYQAQLVAGVTSFCAVAARLNIPLVEQEEMLHVVPGTYNDENDSYIDLPGTKIIMKSGKKIGKLKEQIAKRGLTKYAKMIECCGMSDEKVYEDFNEVSEDSHYFSVIILKEKRESEHD